MKKVRNLRMTARTIQFFILAIVALYAVFCFYFVLFDSGTLDGRFFLYSLVPIPFFWYAEIKERQDTSPFLVKLNRLFAGKNVHIREATDTEKKIVKSFFDEKGYEMPLLFTCRPTEEVNALIGHCHQTKFLLFTEEAYWKCSPQEIWVILAHEVGHLINRDILLMAVENILWFLCWWFSVLVMIKIFFYSLMYHNTWHPSFDYPAVAYTVILFWFFFKDQLKSVLYVVKEVLADNTAAQILGSPQPVIGILEKYVKEDAFSQLRRISALRRVLKKTF
ncbi:MAG: M48 family metalloprotease [Candidatus Parcubacteria bacterium]|nr:M48 family metalloprotease [Candidatus Parcubacteria bacterium]